MDHTYWFELRHERKGSCKEPIEDKRTNSRIYFQGMYLPPPIPSDPWRHDDIFCILNKPLRMIEIMSHHVSISVFMNPLWCLPLVFELCGSYYLNAQIICCFEKSPWCVFDIPIWLSNPCHTCVVGQVELMGRTFRRILSSMKRIHPTSSVYPLAWSISISHGFFNYTNSMIPLVNKLIKGSYLKIKDVMSFKCLVSSYCALIFKDF